MRSMVRFGDYRVLVERPTPGFPAGSARFVERRSDEFAVVVSDNGIDEENIRCAQAWLELHRADA